MGPPLSKNDDEFILSRGFSLNLQSPGVAEIEVSGADLLIKPLNELASSSFPLISVFDDWLIGLFSFVCFILRESSLAE